MFINPCNGIITCKTEHRNLGGFCLWNSRNLESVECFPFGNRNPEFWNPEYNSRLRIPLTNGIQNPSSADKDSGIHYLESGIYNVESKIQDCDSFSYMERGDAQSTSSHPHVREGRKIGTQKRNSASHNYIANILQSKKRLKGGNKEIPYWWSVTTQIWVVVLIGRTERKICFN